MITAPLPRSELTPVEQIAAISLARRMISRLVLLLRVLCSGGGREEGAVGVGGAPSHVTALLSQSPGVGTTPCGPLSLRMAGNSWFPRRDVWLRWYRAGARRSLIQLRLLPPFNYIFLINWLLQHLGVFACLLPHSSGVNAEQVL